MVKKKKPTLRREVQLLEIDLHESTRNLNRKLRHLDKWKENDYQYHEHCKRCRGVTVGYSDGYCEACSKHVNKRNRLIKKYLLKYLLITAGLVTAFLAGRVLFCGVV